jgi:Protein of unknown function (DUF3245)
MAPVNPTVIPMPADFNVIQNRVAVALAKRERLIKSWTASSSRPKPLLKTQEELDAEDADLFNPTPAGLGLGAPIPKEFLDGDVKRKEISTNDKLRHLILGKRAGLQASKPRDGKEKAGSAKRGLGEESSDEDQGRSALGKVKKSKNGSMSSTAIKPSKDATQAESKAEVKSMTDQNGITEPGHVSRAELKSQIKPDKRTETSQEKPSFRNLKIQSSGQRKRLVDYDSDDEGEENDGELVSTAAQKQRSAISNVTSISSSSTKAVIDVRYNAGNYSRSEASAKSKSATPPTADALSGIAEQVKHLPHDGITTPRKPSSKSGSSHSSKSRASSTESEPSDMETAIPLALTSDVVGRTSLPATDSIASAIEIKRAKKRQKRARGREKEQQRKALALGIASGGAEKSVIASAIGTGVAKKIKDRLLDANGN